MNPDIEATMYVDGECGPIDMSMARDFIRSMGDMDNCDLEMQIEIFTDAGELCVHKEKGDYRPAIVTKGRRTFLDKLTTPGRHLVPGRKTDIGKYTRAEYRSCRSWHRPPCLRLVLTVGACSRRAFP